MMPQENSMPQDDASQDKSDTIELMKQVFQKLINDMTAMESDRMLPDGHPKKMAALPPEAKPQEGSAPEEAMESPDEESSEDPGMLDDLLGKADSAGADGAMPEDAENDVPPELADVIKKKKAGM